MKKPLLIFLLFVSMASAKAQDQIITIKQDTIDCKIVSINAERIAYEQETPDKLVVGKSISTSDVLEYFHSGKRKSFVDNNDHEKIKREPEHRWLLSFQGGLAQSLTDYSSFRTLMFNMGSSVSDADYYTQKLRNGYHINMSTHYLVTTFLGLGLDYNLFYSSSKGKFLASGYGFMNVPVYSSVGLDERLYTHFAGLSVSFNQFLDKNKRIKISETISPGIVFFRDETRSYQYQNYSYSGSSLQYYNHTNSVTKSTNFGAKGGLSIEYGITPQLSAGLSGNFMWSTVKKISVKSSEHDTNDHELEIPVNISHIDYGFTVRYNF